MCYDLSNKCNKVVCRVCPTEVAPVGIGFELYSFLIKLEYLFFSLRSSWSKERSMGTAKNGT